MLKANVSKSKSADYAQCISLSAVLFNHAQVFFSTPGLCSHSG